MEKLAFVLKRIDSRHLASLWGFFRNYFLTDEECLEFIYKAFEREPENPMGTFHLEERKINTYVNVNSEKLDDQVFIPRRMLNAVQRFVSVARDMDHIRFGKDIFKIVHIVTCVETLQKLSGKEDHKKEFLFTFFEEYVSLSDQQYVSDHFSLVGAVGTDYENEHNSQQNSTAFKQFIGIINEYRNRAVHEGNFWDNCFNNYTDYTDDTDGSPIPVTFTLSIDLKSFSRENKKEHSFTTKIRYRDFENIFVRACIAFLKHYCDRKVSKEINAWKNS